MTLFLLLFFLFWLLVSFNILKAWPRITWFAHMNHTCKTVQVKIYESVVIQRLLKVEVLHLKACALARYPGYHLATQNNELLAAY